MKTKKPFKDTSFGKFLNKASGVVPDILNVGGKILTGNVGGAIEEVSNLLKKKAETDADAKELLVEFEKYKMQFEKDLYQLEVEDRKSARSREIEIAKSGRFDFMMLATGITGLGSFLFLIYAVVYIPSVIDNKLFVHLLGMVEGVVISNIFAYYYGTSKSSKDKDNKL